MNNKSIIWVGLATLGGVLIYRTIKARASEPPNGEQPPPDGEQPPPPIVPVLYKLDLQVSSPGDSINRMFHSIEGFWVCRDLGYISMGTSGDWVKRGFAARFKNAIIPRSAEITKAYLVIYGYGPMLWQSGVNEYIAAEASDNAPSIVDEIDWESRLQTINKVDWNNVQQFNGINPYASPDLSLVIQEIVNRPSWVPGNAIQIMANDDDFRSSKENTAYRIAWAYSGNSSLAPILHIEFMA